jgi:hypothetical protein
LRREAALRDALPFVGRFEGGDDWLLVMRTGN